jgi:hypothetical protein
MCRLTGKNVALEFLDICASRTAGHDARSVPQEHRTEFVCWELTSDDGRGPLR